MPGEMRAGQYEPVTPPVNGRAPGWIVRCMTCDFAADAHGDTAADACRAIEAVHAQGHTLTVQPVDYGQHPLYS